MSEKMFNSLSDDQQRSKNTEKVTHNKGRLLDQAVILFNCVPFQMGTALKGKNLLPKGAIAPRGSKFFP